MGKFVKINDSLILEEYDLDLMIEVDENNNPINHPFMLENLIQTKPSDFLENPKKYGFVKFVRRGVNYVTKNIVSKTYEWNEKEQYFEDTYNLE